jgi:fido (protein-threonine AMPylation protein)
MPDWDDDSPRLAANLRALIELVARRAEDRATPQVAHARRWQRIMMDGLEVPEPIFVGAFRGETGLEDVQVRIAGASCVPAEYVSSELIRFEAKLRGLVAELDAVVPVGSELDADRLSAIFDACAWAHSEWVRIHPFANGNGRTARLWANTIAMRYGLPPFIRLRPRPSSGYAEACARAMQGDWTSTAIVFRQLFDSYLDATQGP